MLIERHGKASIFDVEAEIADAYVLAAGGINRSQADDKRLLHGMLPGMLQARSNAAPRSGHGSRRRSEFVGTNPDRPLQIAVLSSEQPEFESATLQLLAPFRLLEQDFKLHWAMRQDEQGAQWLINPERLLDADLIVVQGGILISDGAGLLAQLKDLGKPLIYAMIGSPPFVAGDAVPADVQENFEAFARQAAALVVATPELKRACAHLHRNIHVLPRYVDTDLWSRNAAAVRGEPRSGPLRMLCVTPFGADEDYGFFLSALERVKTVYGDAVEFVFSGAWSPDGCGSSKAVADPRVDYRAYANAVSTMSLDMVLAPVSASSSAGCADALRWQESASLGVPGIFSDVPQYRVIEDGRTGLLVPDSEIDWFAAIDRLVREPEQRMRIGAAARAEVLAHWSLKRHAQDYAAVYRAVWQASCGAAAAPTERETPTLEAEGAEFDFASAKDKRLAARYRREFGDASRDFSVLVRAGESDAAGVLATRYELDKQWVRPAQVHILTDIALDAVNQAAASCDTEWVVFLRTRDSCDPALIAQLSRAVAKHPEWGMIYLDEAQLGEDAASTTPHFKPDFNLDYLRSIPYTGNTFAVRTELFKALGGFDGRYDGIEEYDFVLRAYERVGADGIGHVSGPLVVHKPGVSLTQRPLAEVIESGRRALAEHLARLGVAAEVEHGALPATYRVRYRHEAQPLVSIVIPTRNQRALLERCLESLFAHTAWPNFEILIVDNGSDEQDAVQYLAGLRAMGAEVGDRIRVLDYPQPFNYSAMNNLAARVARGEYLLLLNNDTAALHEQWLDTMMSHAQRPEVGVVGAKLLYPDGKVQHAGVLLGLRGPAEHPFVGSDARDPGYYARLQLDQNYSAVTGACLLVRRSLFEAVGGLDEDELAVSYSDIDLCLKVREQGRLIVWTPHALLLHEGSKSQTGGVEKNTDSARQTRFESEQAVMYRRWLPQIAADPAYNRRLSLSGVAFSVEQDPVLDWEPDWKPVPRVLAQPADHMGCGEYRVIAPVRALNQAGLVQGLSSDRIYSPAELARINPDALILQRQVDPHQIKAIERHKRFNDTFCVFEIDDLITNVPVRSAHKRHLPKDLYKRLRQAVSLCDRLVVATEALADEYRGLCGDVRVVPNFVEEARWGGFQPLRQVGRKPRVGWAGGVSHTGDLELIAGVVEALKDDVEWVFFGMCPERLRPFVHEFHEPVPLDEYAAHLASLNLDLALAPLEDVPFNHAKSHLRLLEYGMLGYPVVCSDITPYRGDFPVVRVRNRFRDWLDAIRAHIEDPQMAAAQGNALRERVRANWLLERNLEAWCDGWMPTQTTERKLA